MFIDPALALAGALVGFLVGLTGMGGGALLTPLLVLVFGVPPLTAVSSDLVTSLVMKPFAGAVHLRRGTVHLQMFAWLAVGSVPAAFLASVALGRLATGPDGANLAAVLKIIIAVSLLASVAAMVGRPLLALRARRAAAADAAAAVERVATAADNGGDDAHDGGTDARPPVHRRRTVLIGVIGGIAVGLTSVGAGSLVIAMLLLAYPRLRARSLIGTDIVQAIPLVGAAALGHLLFGDVHFGLTAALLLGGIPGALLGARLSSGAPEGLVRPAMSAVLAASALALLGAATPVLLSGAALTALAVVATSTRPRRPALPEPAPAAAAAVEQ